MDRHGVVFGRTRSRSNQSGHLRRSGVPRELPRKDEPHASLPFTRSGLAESVHGLVKFGHSFIIICPDNMRECRRLTVYFKKSFLIRLMGKFKSQVQRNEPCVVISFFNVNSLNLISPCIAVWFPSVMDLD